MVKKEYEFQETSRNQSYGVDDAKNRKYDSRNYKAKDQGKDNVISDAKFLEILEGVLHEQEADALQQQNNTD